MCVIAVIVQQRQGSVFLPSPLITNHLLLRIRVDQVKHEVQAVRDVASADPGSLSLVPYAAEARALAIRTGDFAQAIAAVRSQVAAHRWHQRRQREAAAHRVVEWQSGGGAAHRKELLDVLPSLSSDAAQLRARPLGAGLIWVRVSSPAAILIPKMLAMKRDTEQIRVLEGGQGEMVPSSSLLQA